MYLLKFTKCYKDVQFNEAWENRLNQTDAGDDSDVMDEHDLTQQNETDDIDENQETG